MDTAGDLFGHLEAHVGMYIGPRTPAPGQPGAGTGVEPGGALVEDQAQWCQHTQHRVGVPVR